MRGRKSKMKCHELIEIDKDCFDCDSRICNIIFLENKAMLQCKKCKLRRDLTHTEVNSYCWMWA